ncbi:MAG: hypothetical protein FJ313_03990 [Gemmatimonadetes bacterium]|nr:hypothetical protein [Gemmatimonadota bacterium]
MERSYGRVRIEKYAKIYSCSMIMPGVTVSERAIVAAKSLVNRNVASGTVVAGAPARAVRERDGNGRASCDLGHVWLKDGAFQGDEPFWEPDAILFDLGEAAAGS